MINTLRITGTAAVSAAIGVVLFAPASTAAPAKATGTKIALHSSPMGKVLVGAGGKFLYVHVKAKKDVGCNPICQAIWPVATTSGKPVAGKGVKASLLGRSGNQITYKGHKLWYYSPDPQHPTGDGANSFGGDWLLVTPKAKFK